MNSNCRIIPAVAVKYPVRGKVNVMKRLQHIGTSPNILPLQGRVTRPKTKKTHKVAKNKASWSMCVDTLVNRVTQTSILQPRGVKPHCKSQRVKEKHPFMEYNLIASFYRYFYIGILLTCDGPDIKHHHGCALLPRPLHEEEKVDLVFNSCLQEMQSELYGRALFVSHPRFYSRSLCCFTGDPTLLI